MVKRVIRLMYGEVRGLHQAAYLLAVFTLGSQILALIRDRLLAHQFGAGAELDVYYTAFRIPDLLYVLFASMLSVYVLIPFVSARLRTGGATAAQQLLREVASLFVFAYILLACSVFVAAPYLVPFIAPGLEAYAHDIVLILRILLLQPLLLGFSSLFGVITQLGHRFVLYAVSPLLYNFGIIFGVAYLYPIFGIAGLGYGVALGALAHLLVQWPFVAASDLRFGLSYRLSLGTLRDVLAVSVPRALTLALHQVSLLALAAIASLMTLGSVAVFQFAYNLQSVPLAVIGASYSIAAFPLLADLFAQQKLEQFRFHVLTALRHLIFWSVPITGLIIVLRAQLVRVVLGSGSFDWADTRLTAAVLATLAISLLAQAINLLIVRTFYAGGYTRIPFLVTFFGTLATVTVSYVLFLNIEHMPSLASVVNRALRIEAVAGSEVIIIAAAYSVGMVLQTCVMLVLAARQFALPIRNMWAPLLRSCLAACAGGFSAYTALNFFVFGINPEAFIGVLLHGFMGGVIGVLAVIATYYLTRAPELREIATSLHGRFKKTEVVTVQDDVL